MKAQYVERKLETVDGLHGLETQTASLILFRKKHFEKLKKLKEYSRMKSCTFRDEQIEILLNGE